MTRLEFAYPPPCALLARAVPLPSNRCASRSSRLCRDFNRSPTAPADCRILGNHDDAPRPVSTIAASSRGIQAAHRLPRDRLCRLILCEGRAGPSLVPARGASSRIRSHRARGTAFAEPRTVADGARASRLRCPVPRAPLRRPVRHRFWIRAGAAKSTLTSSSVGRDLGRRLSGARLHGDDRGGARVEAANRGARRGRWPFRRVQRQAAGGSNSPTPTSIDPSQCEVLLRQKGPPLQILSTGLSPCREAWERWTSCSRPCYSDA